MAPTISLRVSIPTVLTVAVVSYLLLVKALRYRRLRLIEELCPESEIHKMTPALAQRILHITMFYEVPATMILGVQVGLFKIWAIPSSAEIFLKTKTFKSHMAMSRRLADTAILMASWNTYPLVGPGSGSDQRPEDADPRPAIAIARVNWLHRHHNISQDDYRYLIALFILEPIFWTEKLAWRPLTPVERHALFVWWMEIGRRLEFDLTWSSIEEMKEWAADFEKEAMKPSRPSAELGDVGSKFFASNLPGPLKPMGPYMIGSILGPRARDAMMLPKTPEWAESLFFVMLYGIAFIVKHMFLPRRKPAINVTTDDLSAEYLSQLAPEDLPRMHSIMKRPGAPWYYPEPKGLAKVQQTILRAVGLMPESKIPSKQWKSEGYRLEELGPERYEKFGHAEVMKLAEEIHGAPITGPWSLSRNQVKQ